MRYKQWNVRGAVGLAGLFHFLHSCALGSLVPFLTLYFRYLGLTAAMTGTIMASKHFVALLWRPTSSVLARHYNKRRMVIMLCLIFSAVVPLMLLLFPPTGISTESGSCNISQLNANRTKFGHTTLDLRTTPQKFTRSLVFSTEHEERSAKAFSGTEAVAENVSAYFNAQSIAAGLNATVHDIDIEVPLETKGAWTRPGERRSRSLNKLKKKQNVKELHHNEFLGNLKVMDAQHQMFFLVMIIVCLWEVMAAPVEWTADDGLHEYLDFVDATDRHRAVQYWKLLGAAGGVGKAGILVSFLYCLIGTVLHFYTYAAFMVLTASVAALLPLYRHKRERVPGVGWKAVKLVQGDPRALLCAISALLTGMAGSAVSDFILWQMQNHNATELQMGIILGLTPLCQAVLTPLNGTLTRLLKCHGRMLLLCIIGFSLQCLCYSLLWTPWAALPAQLLAGLSTGALLWSMEAQCMDIASPGTERAVQRVFEAFSLDLGAGLGSLAGGLVVEKFGVVVLFQGTAAMLALWGVALAVLQWRIPRQQKINYSRLLVADASEMSESDSEQETDWLEKAMEEDKGNNNWRRQEK
ncbi:major facilitator superfamily domain-containing protein 6-like [Electrophorus electricus]|uniref:major facilitator superfamily domain-containing protein 6-like n=1 Tax=Electrophorus electricus TaxID=8005 RepID=UPI0015D00EED|nr:major facilitator superfamily domain-containing protein 6-like [Electrophorus electricus]